MVVPKGYMIRAIRLGFEAGSEISNESDWDVHLSKIGIGRFSRI